MATKKKPTANNDKIIGTSGNDSINALAGNDTITGQSGKDTLLGNTGNDSLDGGVGNDSLSGGAGKDTLLGGADHDVLQGDGDDDKLDGGAGNDTLDGGTGADTLTGGDGNDVYAVDNTRDRIVEASGRTSGQDLAKSSVNYVLPANVENLELTGQGHLQGTGSDGKNLLTGNAGDNLLDGKNGFDTLMGGEGDDTLLGGGGIDRLIGGDGSDTYQISSTEDIIVETARDGDQDVVETSVSYALGDNLEVMLLTGSGRINGTGNGLDNTLEGNGAGNELSGEAGDDSLNGMGGDDTLQGGEGNDTLDGGEGSDTVIYDGSQENYSIIYDADSQTWLVEDVNEEDGNEETDEITNVEFLQFADVLYDPETVNKPVIRVDDLSLNEGSHGALTDFEFTVNLSAPARGSVSLDYRVESETAVAGVDFADTSGTLNFEAGETSTTFSIPVFADTVSEADKTFRVILSNPDGADIPEGADTATGTIRDDDKVELSIARLEVEEGNTGSKNVLVTVSLNTAASQTVTVNYTLANGTATAGTDYITRGGSLSFGPGVKQQTIPITLLGDTVTESDENFFVTLSGAKNALISSTRGKADVVIKNDDAPVIAIDSASRIEGSDGNTTTLDFTVKLPASFKSAVSVDYRIQSGTATENVDFFGSGGTLVFAPGQTVKTIPVTVVADTQSEGDETFTVQLSNPVGVALDPAASRGTGTIQDDDQASLSIADVTLVEGNGSARDAVLTVNLSSLVNQTVTVNYSTIDGTASAGSDYQAKSGTLSFAPGVAFREIRIPILGDTQTESGEDFQVVLSNPKNAGLSAAESSATVTISDDDLPLVSISNASTREGGPRDDYQMEFKVNLSTPANRALSVDYLTQSMTALEGEDYTAIVNTLNFAAGEQTKTILIPLIGDTITEASETFRVQLENPQGVLLDSRASSATGTVLDDDVAEIFFSDINPQIIEGNPGDGYTVDLRVELSSPSTQTVTVNYSLLADSARSGVDYGGTSGTLTFQPGITNQTFSIPVVGDRMVEPDETFFIQLASAKNATVNSSTGKATVSILNDDLPTVSISGTAIQEGQFSDDDAVLKLTLSSPSTQPVSVNVFSQDDTATANVDYAGVDTTVFFAPGIVSQQIRIPIYGDTTPEPDETFGVYLRDASNAEVSDSGGQATVSIRNDDMPQMRIEGTQIEEGTDGNNEAVLRVSLSAASDKTVTARYTTANATALAGSDYQAQSAQLSFEPGTTEQEIRIPVIADRQNEPDESFSVQLGSLQNATLDPAATSAKVTLIDDDDVILVPVVFIQGDRQTPILANEGQTIRVNVALSQPVSSVVSVNCITQPFNDLSAATAGLDYEAINQTLTFQPGETLKTVQIPVRDDAFAEGLERFSLRLDTPRGVRLPSPDEEYSLNGGGRRDIEIQDNDTGFGGTGGTGGITSPVTNPGTASLRYHLFNGKWYNNIDHTQSVAVSTVTAALKNGPTTVQIDGLDTPAIIQISGWTPDDKLVFNTRDDDVQPVLGTAKTFADTDLGLLLYGRRYTTTKTNTFGTTSQIQRVTGVLWETTSKGTAHWIVYGTANPSTSSFPVSPEWVDGLDKTLAKINPAGGVYGDYLKASDIQFI